VSKSTVESRQQIDTPDRRAAQMAARAWGVLSMAELRACGLSDHGVAARVRRGRLHRVHRGVYAVGHAGLTMRGRFLAAVKACGEGAVLSHLSAAALWDLVAYDQSRAIDVIATGPRRIPGVAAHRTKHAPPTVRYDNIPVTTPARTLIDLSSVLPFKPLRRAVREAFARKRITASELAGTPLIQEADNPTRSQLEDLVLDLIERGGLERPRVNEPLQNGYIPDFRWPGQRLILEADSRTHHDDPVSRQDDAQRQARLEAEGERVLRVTYLQAVTEPDITIERLKRAGAPQRIAR
jgi:very-short-patch-repair endonuclease/predicted transcriptional regulator of viral defense system